MSARISGAPHAHEAEPRDPSHEQQAEAQHNSQAHTQQELVSRTMMQRAKMRVRLQHNKAMAAAFWHSRRFAVGQHKPLSPANAKLLRALGQRPRPGAPKPHGKDTAREEPLFERKPEHDPDKERDKEHERDHDREREKDRDDRRDDKHDGHSREQRGGHSHSGGQQSGGQQDQRQHSQHGQQQRREHARAMTVRGGGAHARVALQGVQRAHRVAPPERLQALATANGSAASRAQPLAAAFARELVRFIGQTPNAALLAPLAMLGATGPMVMRRNRACLLALHAGASSRNTQSASARWIGHTLDLTLARQRFGVQFGMEEQTLAMTRQHLIDAMAAHRGAGAKANEAATANTADADASQIPRQVRVAANGA
ncbi:MULTISPECIES: hypothetical protein [unclassified Paraburkholderia]|uniref:hypothetical protein n=1 Tax=unclassified Paraburkholderia TaxID=2615204 RepID=UPI002AAF82B0|nr:MULTISPECIES: hypothetical protein [unclassified Paraburkholderia]